MSFASEISNALAVALEAKYAQQWPDVRWQSDILGFCRRYFGIEPWSKQAEVLLAIQNGDRVSVASGHKIGKTFLVAVAALWYYSSFHDARVVLMASTFRQVEWIAWREVRKLFKLAARRGTPLDGHLHEIASSGVRAPDDREIRGFTADRAEDAAGISGASMFFIFDEASGIDDRVWQAMTGNMAGGVKVIAISNPTRSSGWFYETFHGSKQFWQTFRISSEETPNAVTGKRDIPGLATREWIDERRAEWGEDSTVYRIRVRGEFAIGEDAKICPLHIIEQAQDRYSSAKEDGRLIIGLDPAESIDNTAFVAVRGKKMIQSWSFKNLSPDAHAVQLSAILDTLRRPREEPMVVVDREGQVGAAVYGFLRSHAEAHKYQLVGIRASDKARDFKIYGRIRDELWANMSKWLRTGAIPDDARLTSELHSAEWATIDDRMKATTKEKLRSILGHSPDIADALALAVWEASPWQFAPETPADKPRPRRPTGKRLEMELDPYAGAGVGIDPYG